MASRIFKPYHIHFLRRFNRALRTTAMIALNVLFLLAPVFAGSSFDLDDDLPFDDQPVVEAVTDGTTHNDLADNRGLVKFIDNATFCLEHQISFHIENDMTVDGKVQYKNLRIGFVFQDKKASRTTNYKSTDTDYLDSGTEWHIRFFNSTISHLYQKSKWSAQSKFY